MSEGQKEKYEEHVSINHLIVFWLKKCDTSPPVPCHSLTPSRPPLLVPPLLVPPLL